MLNLLYNLRSLLTIYSCTIFFKLPSSYVTDLLFKRLTSRNHHGWRSGCHNMGCRGRHGHHIDAWGMQHGWHGGQNLPRAQAHHRTHWRSGYDRNRREQCGPHWRCHLEYTQEPLVRRTSTSIFAFDSIKLIFQNSWIQKQIETHSMCVTYWWVGFGQAGDYWWHGRLMNLVGLAGADLLLGVVLLYQTFSFVNGLNLLLQGDVSLSRLLGTSHTAWVTIPCDLQRKEDGVLDEHYFLMVFLTQGSPLVILGGQNTLKTISIVFFLLMKLTMHYILSIIFIL